MYEGQFNKVFPSCGIYISNEFKKQLYRKCIYNLEVTSEVCFKYEFWS